MLAELVLNWSLVVNVALGVLLAWLIITLATLIIQRQGGAR